MRVLANRLLEIQKKRKLSAYNASSMIGISFVTWKRIFSNPELVRGPVHKKVESFVMKEKKTECVALDYLALSMDLERERLEKVLQEALEIRKKAHSLALYLSESKDKRDKGISAYLHMLAEQPVVD